MLQAISMYFLRLLKKFWIKMYEVGKLWPKKKAYKNKIENFVYRENWKLIIFFQYQFLLRVGGKSSHGLISYTFGQVWEIFSFDFCQHPDHYSRTKSIAEQTVLNANGLLLKGEIFISTLPYWVKHPSISSKYLPGFLEINSEQLSFLYDTDIEVYYKDDNHEV